jgi:small-conductance mechanosensitive channel
MTRLLQSLLLFFVALQVVVVAEREHAEPPNDGAGLSAALEEIQRVLDLTKGRLIETEQRLHTVEHDKSSMEQSLQSEIAALKSAADANVVCQDELIEWKNRVEFVQKDMAEQQEQAVEQVTSYAEVRYKRMETQLMGEAEGAQRRIQALTDEKSTVAQLAKDLEQQVNSAKDKTLQVRQELLAAHEKILDLEKKAKESILAKAWRGLKETEETRVVVDLVEETAVWVQTEVWPPTLAAMITGKEITTKVLGEAWVITSKALGDAWVALEPARKQVSVGMDRLADTMKPVLEREQVKVVLAYRQSMLVEAESWVKTTSTTVENYCLLQEKTRSASGDSSSRSSITSTISFLTTKVLEGSQYAKENSGTIVHWTELGLYILQVYALMVILMYAFSSCTSKKSSKYSDSVSTPNGHKKNHNKHHGGGKGGHSPKAKKH